MTSIVVIHIGNDYLFIKGGRNWSEVNKAPLRLTTNTGELTREEAKKSLLEQLPTVVDNPLAQAQSPISIRSPSGNHETWKSRVYVPGDKWGFVKGGCNPGESALDCAVRELKEETSLEVRDNRRFRHIPELSNRSINVYDLRVTIFEKRIIDLYFLDRIVEKRLGEVFDYVWDDPKNKPDYIEFNSQSEPVLRYISNLPRIEVIPQVDFYSSDFGRRINQSGRNRNTRRRKNGKKRRHSRKHI